MDILINPIKLRYTRAHESISSLVQGFAGEVLTCVREQSNLKAAAKDAYENIRQAQQEHELITQKGVRRIIPLRRGPHEKSRAKQEGS
jgi:hypothetical protein